MKINLLFNNSWFNEKFITAFALKSKCSKNERQWCKSTQKINGIGHTDLT